MQSNLQGAYENAKARGSELAALSKSAPPHLKAQLLQASKTYHAIATVIFASLCSGQISELESFIQTSSQSLPPSLFESKEWGSVIEAAESNRKANGVVVLGTGEDTAVNAGKVAEMQVALANLSKDVSSEISTMGSTLSTLKAQLIPLLKKETQRYTELQMKFADIDDNHQKAMADLTKEYEDKLLASKEAESASAAEVEQQKANEEVRVDELKYGYESEIDTLKERIADLEDSNASTVRIAELEASVKSLRGDLDSSESALAACTDMVSEKEAIISSQQSDIDNLAAEKKNLQAAGLEKDESLRRIVENLEAQVKKSNSLEEERNALEIKSTQLEKQNEKLSEDVKVLTDALAQANANLKAAAQKEIVHQTHDMAASLIMQSEEHALVHIQEKISVQLESELQEAKQRLDATLLEEQKVKAEEVELMADLSTVRAALEEKTTEARRVATELAQLQVEHEALKATSTLQGAENQELAGQKEALDQRVAQLQAQIDEFTAREVEWKQTQGNQSEDLKRALEETQHKLEDTIKEEEALKAEEGALEGDVMALRAQLVSLAAERDAALKKASDENTALANKVKGLEDEVTKLKDTVEGLEGMQLLVDNLAEQLNTIKHSKEMLKKHHKESLEAIRISLEESGILLATHLPEQQQSGKDHHHHHHVKFADEKPKPEEFADEPLMQRLTADVKLIKEHMLEVEEKSAHLEEIEKQHEKKEEELQHELVEKDKQLGAELAVEDELREASLEREQLLATELAALRKELTSTKAALAKATADSKTASESSALEAKALADTAESLRAKLREEEEQLAQSSAKVQEVSAADLEKISSLERALSEAEAEKTKATAEQVELNQQIEQLKKALEQEKEAKTILEQDLSRALEGIRPSTPTMAGSNETGEVPKSVKQLVDEIQNLEKELKDVQDSVQGMALSSQGKNEELLRVIHTLKCVIDEKDAVLSETSSLLKVKTRNADDAEAMELKLLREVADLTAEKAAAIKACDFMRDQLTALAHELGGAQVLIPEVDATSALEVRKERVIAREQSASQLMSHMQVVDSLHQSLVANIEALRAELVQKDETIQKLLDQVPETEDRPEREPGISSETTGVNIDSIRYLSTIEDLRQQVEDNKLALQRDLEAKQSDLETARAEQQRLESIVSELKEQRVEKQALQTKAISGAIIRMLAVDTAAQAEAAGVVKQSGSILESEYVATISELTSELEATRKDLEVARSRPTTSNGEDLPSPAKNPVDSSLVAVAEVLETMVTPGRDTASSAPAPAPAPAPASARTPAPYSQTISFDTPSEEKEEIFDVDAAFEPSRYRNKMGERRKLPRKDTPMPKSKPPPSDEATAESPNLHDALLDFYTPSRSRSGDPSSTTSEAMRKSRTRERSQSPGGLSTRSKQNPPTEKKEMDIEEVNKFCDEELAKEAASESRFRKSVVGKDEEIKELHLELHALQQALSSARGEVVVRMMMVVEAEDKLTDSRRDVENGKRMLEHAEEKIRTLEMRREQADTQKTQVEEKLQEYLKIARKASDLESQLFDATRILKQTASELERTKAALLDAVQHADWKYRMKIMGTDRRIVHGVSKVQAVVRGVLSRLRTQDRFVQRVAADLGTLIAKEGTVQGESGWYIGPDGSTYYFLHEQGEWTITSGPLTNHQYKSIIDVSRRTDKAAQSTMMTPYECDVKVPVPSDSRVYMDNTSKKLFMVSPLRTAS